MKLHSFISIICPEIYIWITRVLQKSLRMVTQRWMHRFFFYKSKTFLLSNNWFLEWHGVICMSHLDVIFVTKRDNQVGRRRSSFVGLSALKIFRPLSPWKNDYNAVNRYNRNQESFRLADILIENKRIHYPIVKSGSIYNVMEMLLYFK